MLGTAYYHPVMPLIPPADWEAHLERWRGIAHRQFYHSDFQGFWPPEMGFCMEMIPLLRRSSYRFVLVDCEHVQPVTPMRWEQLRYQPHIARFGGKRSLSLSVTVNYPMPRNRGWSFRGLTGKCGIAHQDL